MENRYHHHNRRKYSLKVHIVLVTKYRKQILKGHISDDVKQKIYDIANVYGYEILAMETDKDHIHFLLGCDTTDRVSLITCGRNIRVFLQNVTGRKGSFGQTGILHAVLEKFLRRPYADI